jgi:hypothetical protein
LDEELGSTGRSVHGAVRRSRRVGGQSLLIDKEEGRLSASAISLAVKRLLQGAGEEKLRLRHHARMFKCCGRSSRPSSRTIRAGSSSLGARAKCSGDHGTTLECASSVGRSQDFLQRQSGLGVMRWWSDQVQWRPRHHARMFKRYGKISSLSSKTIRLGSSSWALSVSAVETTAPRSNVQALWEELKAFFKDNPAWE